MSRTIVFFMRRSAAFVVAFALCAGWAHATITLTTIPKSPIKNGETATVTATVESASPAEWVYLQYRFRDAKVLAADPEAPWSAWHEQKMVSNAGNEWTGFLPILPAGEINWCVGAKYADGSSEGKVETVSAQPYDYSHDMKASADLAASCSTPTNGETVVEENWGWQQNATASGGTNFFANTPSGGQWFASGVGWAAADARKFRVPGVGNISTDIDGNASTATGVSLSYPTLFFFNLNPTLKPQIRTPRLRSGVKTISFNAFNVAGTTSKLMVQVAYTDGEPKESDWHDIEEHTLDTAKKGYSFTNEINSTAVTYVRILRTQKNTGSTTPTDGFIGIDDICLTIPEPATQTTEVTDTLDYNRLHDMKGITGIISSASGDHVDASYGWVQDKRAALGRASSTNFYAAAPNGSRWVGSGIGWAESNLKTKRLPSEGATAVGIGSGLTYPVVFFFNLDPEYKPHIRTPKLENGLGTFSFDFNNVAGTTSKLMVQVAYTDSEPQEDDWHEIEEISLSTTGASSHTNIVNDSAVTFVRILRTQKNTGGTVNIGFIGIDNICATPPTPDVVLEESQRTPWYMNATNAITVRCLVSNVLERIPAINQQVTAYYCLTNSATADVATSAFTEVAMTRLWETNGCSLYEGKIPAQWEEGWLHYYFKCDFEGYYYVSPTANGMATPKFFGGEGSTTNAPTSSASTHLKGEVRVSRARYSKVQVMQIVDGGEPAYYDMTLVDDDQWQVSVPVEEGTVTEAYFVGYGCYDEGAIGASPNPWYYGDTDQAKPFDTPAAGTPDRQYGNTNNLPGMVIEVDCKGFMVYRFHDAVDDGDLNYTILRGVFQDFNDWEEAGRYYVESLYGAGVGTREVDFEGWARPYGWLPADDEEENFQLCASNIVYSVKGDKVPLERDFNDSNVLTPEGWYISGFRLTNARIADTNVVYAYGGHSNVLAQIRPGGRFFNADSSLSQGVGKISAVMRSSIVDDAKALYVGDDEEQPQEWSYSSSSPLSISFSFSIPAADRSDAHYYTSIVFDYQDDLNYHELRFTRGDAPDNASSDRRLRMQLVEVRNGSETISTHGTPYDDNKVVSETIHTAVASISMSGSALTVTLSSLSNLPSQWTSLTLKGCGITSMSGLVGLGAYECAPKFDYIVISGGTGGTAYSAGSDTTPASTASSKFSATKSKWWLGGTDDTASSKTATKWFFDKNEGNVLRRRIPNMSVNLKVGSSWYGLTSHTNITVSSLQPTTYSEEFHSWDPFYVEFAVASKGSGNCVVFDSAKTTPWRGGTRTPAAHDYLESYTWRREEDQNIFARSSDSDYNYRDNWLVFEGWVVTNGASSEYISGLAARFQHSQANTNLAQALYSPIMTNGIGTVKFNYAVTGNPGDRVVYAVEYTSYNGGGDFGDGSSYHTAATYTNTVGNTVVSGYRSCNVCTNYLYTTSGDIIQMRFRIRVLNEGTSPDAVLWIDQAYGNDFPEETDDMWKVYNGRLAQAAGEEYARVYGRTGRTLYLNNSMSDDTGEARGLENPFNEWKPYVQAPYLIDGIGEIAFNYRAHSETNATTHAGLLTVAMSSNKVNWVTITTNLVNSTGYVKFDDESIFEKNYHYVRFYTETNEAGRVCIDNILIVEPSRPGYDISEVILMPEQPIYTTESNVAVRVKIERPTLNPTGIRLFASWVVGTNNWGYSNWWSPGLETARNTVELFTNDTASAEFYATPDGKGLPASPANGTIQYVIWGIHDSVPTNYTAQDVIFQKDASFTNPSWYGSVNLNDTFTNAASTTATFSPYYLIYSCPPGSIWINEVWNNYNTSSKKPYPDNSTAYEFIELCGKGGIDISGWKLNIYLKGDDDPSYEVDLVESHEFDEGTVLPYDYNGWGFYVVGDEGTPNVDYILTDASGKKRQGGTIDAFKATTIAIELLRKGGEDGILECANYVGTASANPKNPNAAYSQRISIPTKNIKTSGFSYALLDDYSSEDNPVCTNKIVGTAEDPQLWYWALGYPTPGAVNRDTNNVVNQRFTTAITSFFVLDSMIAEGMGHGTQNGKPDRIFSTIGGGASTSIVYLAHSFYRITALTSNDISVEEAVGKSSYTFRIDSMSEPVINSVSFGPKEGYSVDMISWFNDNGWSEEEIEAGDGDDYSPEEEYLLDTNPTRFTTVSAQTTSISLDDGNATLGLGLWRTNWSERTTASGTATAVSSALRGAVNVYGMSELGGAGTKISKASLGTGAFHGINETTTSFSLTGDAPGLTFFKWKIE